MPEDENPLTGLTDKSSRRSILKTGALASGGLAFGLSATSSAAVASDEDEEDVDENSLNLADITFLQLLIYHHRSGIELAQLVPDRTGRG